MIELHAAGPDQARPSRPAGRIEDVANAVNEFESGPGLGFTYLKRSKTRID